jgi:hypothetical protein
VIALAAIPLLAASAPIAAAPASEAPLVEEVRRAKVRLVVDEKGKLESCEIIATDAPADLAKTICPTFQGKAKFKPKLNAQGKPERTTYTPSIKFVIQS